jgi:hypothetical protein
MSAREAVAEDLDWDPHHRRQLTIARYLLGRALNQYPKNGPKERLFRRGEPSRQTLIDAAIQNGLVWYDEWHHAPRCLANNWSKQMLPEGPCTCGAEREQYR